MSGALQGSLNTRKCSAIPRPTSLSLQDMRSVKKFHPPLGSATTIDLNAWSIGQPADAVDFAIASCHPCCKPTFERRFKNNWRRLLVAIGLRENSKTIVPKRRCPSITRAQPFWVFRHDRAMSIHADVAERLQHGRSENAIVRSFGFEGT